MRGEKFFMNYDIVIIGSGITGASIARELSKYKLRIAVIDKASELPAGASRANSSMIHGGFDDKPGTMKSKFCVPGNKMWHKLKDVLDVHLDECGSYVCAFNDDEVKHLELLLEQGKANGSPGVEIVSGDKMREKEPNVSPDIVAALWSPEAGIINNFEAVNAMIESAKINGAELFLETVATGLLLDDKGSVRGVSTNKGDFLAPVVINAGGVHSGEIASWAGDKSFRIIPTKGEYFLLDRATGGTITSFLFSCPSKAGKGVTVLRTAEGNLMAGPTATEQEDPEDRSTTPEGLAEVLKGARRLVPNFPVNMNITTFAGVRANTESGDFEISTLKTPRGFVNVAGIKSPGFTSAPAIAEYVAEMLKSELADIVTLAPNEKFIPERRNIPRFLYLDMDERKSLAQNDPAYAQIVCRCETVTEGQVIEAIRRGARTVSAVKMMTRAGTGRCQGGFCCPRVAEILSRELGIPLDEITRHGGESRLLVGKTKEFLLKGALSE
ncbi:MAG: NAD(P)/FAD-dependent oxidoreductase [Synergistaceae bacterium]|nr:NAD(P)/FAD-dependent oxidoreductase [Synergistaceae bacterium]MBQ3399080.1 NAD(P)/FAD-dependent oxidoreductase [Synergistaceae bacterium]